jgi:hypothetical protein
MQKGRARPCGEAVRQADKSAGALAVETEGIVQLPEDGLSGQARGLRYSSGQSKAVLSAARQRRCESTRAEMAVSLAVSRLLARYQGPLPGLFLLPCLGNWGVGTTGLEPVTSRM